MLKPEEKLETKYGQCALITDNIHLLTCIQIDIDKKNSQIGARVSQQEYVTKILWDSLNVFQSVV